MPLDCYPSESSVIVNGHVLSTLRIPFLCGLSLSHPETVFRPHPSLASRHGLPTISVQTEYGTTLHGRVEAKGTEREPGAFLVPPVWVMQSPTETELLIEKGYEAEEPYWDQKYFDAVNRKRKEERKVGRRRHPPTPTTPPQSSRKISNATPSAKQTPPAKKAKEDLKINAPSPAPTLTKPKSVPLPRTVVNAVPLVQATAIPEPSSHSPRIPEQFCRTVQEGCPIVAAPEVPAKAEGIVVDATQDMRREVSPAESETPTIGAPEVIAMLSTASSYVPTLFALREGFDAQWEVVSKKALPLEDENDDEAGNDASKDIEKEEDVQTVSLPPSTPIQCRYIARSYEVWRPFPPHLSFTKADEVTTIFRGPTLLPLTEAPWAAQPTQTNVLVGNPQRHPHVRPLNGSVNKDRMAIDQLGEGVSHQRTRVPLKAKSGQCCLVM